MIYIKKRKYASQSEATVLKELVEYVLNPLRLGRIASLFELELEEYLEMI